MNSYPRYSGFKVKIETSYESMFGEKALKEVDYFMPQLLPMNIDEKLIKSVMEKGKKEKKWVLAFVIGTKPCFYKFYGSVMEADKAGIPNFVINSNQHYDDILTFGLNEFNFQNKIGANLAIRGDLAQKSAELMIKVSWLARYLKKHWPDVTVVPVVLGDTILTSIVPAAWMFSRNERAIQNEAGLRSMTPDAMKDVGKIDVSDFIDKQFNGSWSLLRNEPFPEQWDTFVSAAGSEFLFAPLELNKKHLVREGHPEKNTWVTGGVVIDALTLKRKEKAEKSIFNIYPQLEEGRWIRADIHRRGNLTPRRFKAIIGGVKKLVEKGYKVNFIEMSATRFALDNYKLRGEIEKLSKNKNFLFTKVWPEYANVIEFYESEHCFSALTDSGGVQEEMNELGQLCLTCRFNTDRPETVNDAKTNLLVPPVDGSFIFKMVEHVDKNEDLQKQMRSGPKLYGSNVGKKFISVVSDLIQKERPFKWAHEALGLWKETEKSDYL
jgi:UDP-N-acetylglucosamine 2-epimerase (non-hydrolysing)